MSIKIRKVNLTDRFLLRSLEWLNIMIIGVTSNYTTLLKNGRIMAWYN